MELAFRLADAADEVTSAWWTADGVQARAKADGTPVTDADVAAEEAVARVVSSVHTGDGLLGEEIGERLGTSGRRWIVDGIDGTRGFVAGERTWGTLIALEQDGEIVVGVCSSPALGRRWWAARGGGAFTGRGLGSRTRLQVSAERQITAARIVTAPRYTNLTPEQQRRIESFAGGCPADRTWSHQNAVAAGHLDMCIWFCGDVWDHAAPSLIVEEAGGRFSDHAGGHRLDTRTAVYSNGLHHDEVLAVLNHR